MNKRIAGAFLFGLFLIVGGGFVALNIEIFNRITLIDAKCERRSGEEAFTPDNFTFVDIEFDTTDYQMDIYETVTFMSRDGVELSGFLIPAPVSDTTQAKTVIIVHGFNDCKRRPFTLLPASMLNRNGMNVLAIDLRNHGDSMVTVGRMSAGIDEAQDVLGAWDWLVNEKGIPADHIGLFGYSLGGATVIQAMAQEPGIRAVWSDSAFDDIDRVLQNELFKAGLPDALYASVWSLGNLVYGVDLTRNTPALAMADIGERPVYLLHSQADELVPFDAVDALQAPGNGNVTTWMVDEPIHLQMMTTFPEAYETRLVSFFDAVLG